MKKILNLRYAYVVLNGFIFLIPVITRAQFSLPNSNFRSLVLQILSVIGTLIPIMFAMAFIMFFWGVSQFILHSDSQSDLQKGKNYMLWGIIALFVLVTFRSIIYFIVGDLQLGTGTVPGVLLPTQ